MTSRLSARPSRTGSDGPLRRRALLRAGGRRALPGRLVGRVVERAPPERALDRGRVGVRVATPGG